MKDRFRWAKWIVSLGLLFWLLRSIGWNSLAFSLAQASPRWVGYAFIAGFIHFGVSAWRWQLALKSLDGPRLPFSTLLYYYLMSSFFNNFAPGNLGGDAARFITLSRLGNSSIAVTSSIILERIYNLLILCILCLWVLVAQPLPVSIQVSQKIGWSCIAAGVVTGALLICLRHHLPQRIKNYGFQAALMGRKVLNHPLEFGLAIFATFLLNFLLMLITYSNAQAVSIQLSLRLHLAVYSIAGVAIALPITIQGIGIREGIYISLFGNMGIAPESVFAMLTLNYIVLLAFSILGGLLFLSSPGRMHSQAG